MKTNEENLEIIRNLGYKIINSFTLKEEEPKWLQDYGNNISSAIFSLAFCDIDGTIF